MSAIDFIRNAGQQDILVLMDCSHWDKIVRPVQQAEMRRLIWSGEHYCTNTHCMRKQPAVFLAPANELNQEWLILNRL